MSREASCGQAEAEQRIRVARVYLDLAEVALSSDQDEARNAAAGNAVLAAVAASDALCCFSLGRRPRGQDHRVAAELLEKVTPNGQQMAKHLTAALAVKDSAHYGITFISQAKVKSALRSASRLVDAAERVVLGS